MTYRVESIANFFIDKKLKDLTPMKIQRLLFLSQSWNIALCNDYLIDDHFVMWKYGPVIPSLYHKIKLYKENAINDHLAILTNNNKIAFSFIDNKDQQTKNLLEKIYEVYGSYSGQSLASLILKYYENVPVYTPFDKNLLKLFPEMIVCESELNKGVRKVETINKFRL
jgi:uncharacterized phage-associated protein